MAARVKIRLDNAGIGQILRSSGVRSAVNGLAEQVASAARSADEVTRNGATVDTRSYTSDRAGVVVAINHPSGMALQAKHGTLTQAAGSAGLEVRGG